MKPKNVIRRSGNVWNGRFDPHHCPEIAAARWKDEEIQKGVVTLRPIKAVCHVTLSISSAGWKIE
jgi:hypothetical protein